MTVTLADHVGIGTAQGEIQRDGYRDVPGMAEGPRPGFSFAAAWLHAGGRAAVHLIGVPARPDAAEPALRLQHMAFRGAGQADFLARLDRQGIPRRIVRLPEGAGPAMLVNIEDPDGNRLNVDFDPAEAEGLDL